MLKYASKKARFHALTDRLIKEPRDVSEAVIIGYKHLNTGQPLREWDSTMAYDDEVVALVQKHRRGILAKGVARQRFQEAMIERFGMRMSLTTARRFLKQGNPGEEYLNTA